MIRTKKGGAKDWERWREVENDLERKKKLNRQDVLLIWCRAGDMPTNNNNNLSSYGICTRNQYQTMYKFIRVCRMCGARMAGNRMGWTAVRWETWDDPKNANKFSIRSILFCEFVCVSGSLLCVRACVAVSCCPYHVLCSWANVRSELVNAWNW